MSNLQPVPPPEEGPEAKAYDPFDPATLRVNTAADLSVEKVLTGVPVKKPDRREFFRVHPGSSYELDTLLLERNDGMDREAYIVARQIQHLVLPELRRVRLFTAITRRGVVFLWPVKLPIEGEDRFRRISDTALQAANRAKTQWVRTVWNPDLGGYDVSVAKGDLGEPQWPEKSFRDLLEIAFRRNVLDQPDHPVIRELEGEL